MTSDRLRGDLRALGVAPGEVVMLHASVRAIGWVVGGPDAVLRALLDVLTSEGTLMMLAGWEDTPIELREWPEEKRRAYLEDCPAFDPATSRADHREMSILAEYLRTWAGAVRSTHPSSSYVAVGPQAAALLHPHPDQYPFGLDSPLGRFCAHGGRVLLLGRLFRNITLLHHAEQLADVPRKRVVRYRMPVLRGGTRVWADFEEYDTTNGIVDWHKDYFDAIGRAYLKTGRAKRGGVGGAHAYLYDGADLVRFGMRWMEERFAGPP